MNIWLISIFEQTQIDNSNAFRFMSIADNIVKSGNKVTFFSSTFKHNTKSYRYDKTTVVDINDSYKMIYVKTLGYKTNISIKRLLSHYFYSKSLMKEINKINEKPDIVFVAYPPISIINKISLWGKKNNIPIVLDIIDPWPDILNEKRKGLFGNTPNLILRPIKFIIKHIFKKVTAVTAISNLYITWFKKYNNKIQFAQCFYPAINYNETQNLILSLEHQKNNNRKKTRIIYAGNLSNSYDIPTILEAAAILHDHFKDDIEFVIAGKGNQENLIHKYTSKYNNLIYLGFLTKEKLAIEYINSDLGLAQYEPGSTQSVTYKLFDLLSFGLPILNSLEGEMKYIINDNKVGLFNEPGNADMLVNNILLLHNNKELLNEFKKNTLQVASSQGNVTIVYSKLVSFLREIVMKGHENEN